MYALLVLDRLLLAFENSFSFFLFLLMRKTTQLVLSIQANNEKEKRRFIYRQCVCIYIFLSFFSSLLSLSQMKTIFSINKSRQSAMSAHNNHEDYNPVANLNMQPAKSILKSTKSIDEPGQEVLPETNHGMTRSESKR